MTRPNVHLEDTCVVHAHARSDRQITRCGVEYIRDRQDRFMLDNRREGFDTEASVDCMTCLVKDPNAFADIREIIVENSVKDIQEAVDIRFIDAIEWQSRKGPP